MSDFKARRLGSFMDLRGLFLRGGRERGGERKGREREG